MKYFMKYIVKKLLQNKVYNKYKIRYFFDYSAGSCLWSGNELTKKKYGYPILDFEKLGLSNTTIQEIKHLASVYETSFNNEDPHYLAWDIKQCADFDLKSKKLFKKISYELSDNFELVYEMDSFLETKQNE